MLVLTASLAQPLNHCSLPPLVVWETLMLRLTSTFTLGIKRQEISEDLIYSWEKLFVTELSLRKFISTLLKYSRNVVSLSPPSLPYAIGVCVHQCPLFLWSQEFHDSKHEPEALCEAGICSKSTRNTSNPADTARSSVCESDGQPVCTSTEEPLDLGECMMQSSISLKKQFEKKKAVLSSLPLQTDKNDPCVKKCSYIPWTVRKYLIFLLYSQNRTALVNC